MTKNKKKENKEADKGQKRINISADELDKRIKAESEKRKLLKKGIKEHLTQGIDYGTIKFGGKESKPVLFKPGSERIMNWFGLKAVFEEDKETYKMAGQPAGLFCYLCKLINEDGEVVGEGRGAAHENEMKNWRANNAIKMSQKRSQVDAVIRVAGLSEFFTQDLEDMVDEDDKKPKTDIGKYVKAIDDADTKTKLEKVVKKLKADKKLKQVQRMALKTRAEKKIKQISGELPL